MRLAIWKKSTFRGRSLKANTTWAAWAVLFRPLARLGA